ncbi:MAG: hypothetical protein R3E02_03975 [Blastomonas sp.]
MQHHERQRLWWRLTLLAGIAMLAITIAFTRIEGLALCGPSDLRDVLAFEFARGPDDIATIFGGEPCTSRLVAAFTRHTWLDILGYIPAFTLFQIFAALALRQQGSRLAGLVIGAAIIAGLCDQAEDQILLAIMAALPGTQSMTAWLFPFVITKFALLAINCILIGLLVWRRTGGWRIAGGIMMLGGAVGLAGTLARSLYGLLAAGIGPAWVALLIVALLSAFGTRPSRLNQS